MVFISCCWNLKRPSLASALAAEAVAGKNAIIATMMCWSDLNIPGRGSSIEWANAIIPRIESDNSNSKSIQEKKEEMKARKKKKFEGRWVGGWMALYKKKRGEQCQKKENENKGFHLMEPTPQASDVRCRRCYPQRRSDIYLFLFILYSRIAATLYFVFQCWSGKGRGHPNLHSSKWKWIK